MNFALQVSRMRKRKDGVCLCRIFEGIPADKVILGVLLVMVGVLVQLCFFIYINFTEYVCKL